MYVLWWNYVYVNGTYAGCAAAVSPTPEGKGHDCATSSDWTQETVVLQSSPYSPRDSPGAYSACPGCVSVLSPVHQDHSRWQTPS